jgi:NAD(P)-dependent dehydrogenase (short-subunit alcohol dehydrogenase family)
MPTVLITGASHGIGREFGHQYAEAGWRVIATCRDPQAAGLEDALAMDVASQLDVEDVASQLAGEPIDLLINNAGISAASGQAFGSFDYDDWERVLRVNTIAPIRIAEAFADNVAGSERKLMVFLSSILGSIAEGSGGSYTPYGTSKAALNAAMKGISGDLGARGITCISVHPGWVQTDMGGAGAAIDVRTSVSGLRQVIDGLGPGDNGHFFDYTGRVLPW